MPETFAPFTWVDGSAGGTPITAAQLNRLEQGLESVDDRAAALELGTFTPVVLTASGGTITPNPAAGRVFLHDITAADATLGSPAAGSNGQLIDVVVYSSSAARTLTVTGSAVSVSTTSPWWGRFVYVQARDEWVLSDGVGSGGSGYTDEQVDDRVNALIVAGSNITKVYDDVAGTLTLSATGGGGSGGIPDDGSVTNVKVATNAAISLDKTADSATRLAMTAAERTKLTGVASGATANATDAQLRDRSTHTGAQPISATTGLQATLDSKVESTSIDTIVSLTQAAYNALGTKDARTLYVIT